MTMKHSPGPWQAAPDCGDSGHLAAYTDTGRKIALVIIEPVPPGSGADALAIRCANFATAEANARLIAAAPDLLAALQAMVDCPDYRTIRTHEMAAARAALAKVQP